MKPAAEARAGRVAVHFGAHCLVQDAGGELVRCHVARRLGRPVCGDRVYWARTDATDQGVLVEILPRRNELLRHDARAQQRVMAANIDRLLVVLAPAPAPELALLDRYLVAAELLGLQACLVFNKSDLLDAAARRQWESELRPYAALDYRVLFTSLRSGEGLDRLRQWLAGQTGIVVGQSGVGKSSLVSALVPDLALRTRQLSEASGAGQHTTSTTRLYPLPGGNGCLIDSPGVRDFRLWPVTLADLVKGFREFAAAAALCRFPDCRHLQEPGCEIRHRVEAGAISPRRYASYRQLAKWMGKG
ncbi:MAG TPA: ribosome small subunit-dependent GTPase A [Nevskiales bacterium]|nr:ribosome small subunit-dependent GTPase A [Nevskiales bacterium]